MAFYERASGARMHANYFRVGGVHQDLPLALLDDIWAFCDPFLRVCDDIEDLLTENRIFKQRMSGLPGQARRRLGMGASPASWCAPPGRLGSPQGPAYECYPELDFDIPVGSNGDCYDRYLVRMEEMRQSVRIMKQCLDRLCLPEGQGLCANRTIRSCRRRAPT